MLREATPVGHNIYFHIFTQHFSPRIQFVNHLVTLREQMITMQNQHFLPAEQLKVYMK